MCNDGCVEMVWCRLCVMSFCVECGGFGYGV